MTQQPCIYLDYASTHPRKKEVMEAREAFELSSYANVGRSRYALAESAEEAYGHSKKVVADWIGCEPLEVLYTYSATYALNLLALAALHNQVISKGDTILLSLSEHHANIVPWQILADRVGAQVIFVWLDQEYRIDLEDLRNKLDPSVKIVALQYASNVTGAIHPLEKIRDMIGPDRLFCVDASQMGLYWPLSMRDIQCDAMVLSGHKMMADTGIGVLALWKMLQKSWQSPISGGGAINSVSQTGYEQAGIPDRWEPGTPHITGAITLSAAVGCLQKLDVKKRERYQTLLQFISERFTSLENRWLRVFHPKHAPALGVWSFAIPGKHVNDIADIFAEKGICLRSGHHCCEPLHTHFGVPWTVRMSIGYDTTQEEAESFFAVLRTLL